MDKEILILGKEAFDKLNPDVRRFIKQQSQCIKNLMDKLKSQEEKQNKIVDMFFDSYTKIRGDICDCRDVLYVHKEDLCLSYLRIQSGLDIVTEVEFDIKREINKLTHQHEDKGE